MFFHDRAPRTRGVPALAAVAMTLGTVSIACFAQTNVLTYRNDNTRTAQNLSETILTPGNVGSATFGRLFTYPVDGPVDAQPLLVSGMTIGNTAGRNVVFAATENDSVYAFDAATGATYWSVSVLGKGETPSDDRGCGQVEPTIGITSTPVVDLESGAHGTLYVVGMTKDSSGGYHQRLHALDITTGAEQFGGPVEISATFPGTGDNSTNGTVVFDPKQYKERTGLLLVNGIIYTSWASHCDIRPYTGWTMGYNETTLAQTSVFNFSPNGNDGAVWGAGGGVSADSSGNLFFDIANGTFDTALNSSGFPDKGDYGNAFVKIAPISGVLTPLDYWTMDNTTAESNGDVDLGSGGVLLLPDLMDSKGNIRHFGTGAGKDANVYIFDRDNMGKFDSAANATLYQELPQALAGGAWSSPAWFNGNLYYGGQSDVIRSFRMNPQTLMLGAAPTSVSATSYPYPGASPSISADGTTNGILWAVENSSPAVLHAYDATNLATELYNSNQAPSGRDHFGNGNKFITPVIANGTVFVGTPDSVAVFGILPLPVVTLSPPSVSFPNQTVNATSGSQAITVTNNGPGAVTIASIAVTGTNSGDFAQTNNCPLSPATIAVNGTCTVNVTFTPQAATARSAAVAIADNGAGTPQSAVLSGNGVAIPQTIVFPAIPVQIAGGPVFTPNVSAGSGLSVTLVSNSTNVCTVVAGAVTPIAAGTCSLTAFQPGNLVWAPANPVTVTFTVDPVFADTAGDTAAENQALDLMATYGITSGCATTPFDYCPNETVTRAQMAVFIIRSIFHGNNFTWNPAPYFTDVPANAQFFKYIQKMKELGLTSGETATTYGPNDPVSRGQTAVFLIRARYGSGFAFNSTATPYFTDVPVGAQFFRYIQKMKEVGITSGCGAAIYCPNDPVTRGELALFLIRGAFNQLLPSATAPVISGVSPATGTAGRTVTVTLTGTNTNFAQGTTAVSAQAGFTVQNVTVNSSTSLTAQLVIQGGATIAPQSLIVTTGAEEAVAPNGFTITSDPAAGVVAYFTGNNTTVDAVSGLSGSLVNGATYASATSRTQGLPDALAFSLNGTNSYVQAASGETAAIGGARSLVAWVYPNAGFGLGMPILTAGSTLAAVDIFGITSTDGTCGGGGQLYIDHGGTCYVSDNSLLPNTWSFVAMTFDGTNAVFYINGVASVAVPATMNNYGLATYEIGGNTLGGASSAASFNGLLSEVQVYDRALSPAEIQGLYAP